MIYVTIPIKRSLSREMHPKDGDRMANTADPDQTAPLGGLFLWEQSDLGLHCLLRSICAKTRISTVPLCMLSHKYVIA